MVCNVFFFLNRGIPEFPMNNFRTPMIFLLMKCVFRSFHGRWFALFTWRIIPFSKWLITMVSKSPNWGYSPSKWSKWPLNGVTNHVLTGMILQVGVWEWSLQQATAFHRTLPRRVCYFVTTASLFQGPTVVKIFSKPHHFPAWKFSPNIFCSG